MLDRRKLLGAAAATVLAGMSPLGAAATLADPARPPRRPPATQRRVTSPAVEAEIRRVTRLVGNPELAWLFENCYPNVLATTVTLQERDGRPDTFVITGDIPALWLRDSSAQVWPYLPLAASDTVLRRVFRGLIHRHALCILIDPYANAFLEDPNSTRPLSWALHDDTVMKPGVAERKWEVDSLCHPIRLAHGYWRATGDTAPYDSQWRAAMAKVPSTLREQQRLAGPGPYRFQRTSGTPLDTLALDGYGAPTRKVGLIHSMFRPSDDACTYPFLIPANWFAAVSLRQLADMARDIHADAGFARECLLLAREIELAIEAHGLIPQSQGTAVYAYECDGFGNQLFIDDANVPGLLGLPYLGCCRRDDPRYLSTRAKVLSDDNPYFFRGRAAEGIGGPHVGLGMIWPIGIMIRALTSDQAVETGRCLAWLRNTHAGTGFMHEAFDQDQPAHFTRAWFAWANALFGELILDSSRRFPSLLAGNS